MTAFRGDPSEYREFEPGRWRREDAEGNWIEADGITTLSEGVAFADVYERRANPPPPEPDARDAKIAALEAAVSVLKKTGVITEAQIDAERTKPATKTRTP